MFGHDWEGGTATIVAGHERAMRVNDTPLQEYAADVTPDSGAPAFRAKLEQPIWAGGFLAPTVGQTVRVLIDVKHQKAKFDMDDPKLSHGSTRKDRKSEFDATLEQPAGSPVDAAATPAIPTVTATAADYAEAQADEQ